MWALSSPFGQCEFKKPFAKKQYFQTLQVERLNFLYKALHVDPSML